MTNLPPGFSLRAVEAIFRDRARLLIQLQRVHLAELAEHRKIVARSATDLENARMFRRIGKPPYQGSEHLPPRAVPPVPLVQRRHLLIDDPLHQRKTQCRLSVKVTSGVTNSIGAMGAARPHARNVKSSQTQKLFSA